MQQQFLDEVDIDKIRQEMKEDTGIDWTDPTLLECLQQYGEKLQEGMIVVRV